MFTGIIESMATIISIEIEGTNHRMTFESSITPQLQIDQSVSHNGVCLTVVGLSENQYSVDVIQESLERSNLKYCKLGDQINLERSMGMEKLFDGHIVQGHVDTTLVCQNIENNNGSWLFHFGYEKQHASLLIPKGSICLNGVSLTIADLTESEVTVAIIPYTFDYTNFHNLRIGDQVNVEFDLIGKYINRIMATRS